MTIPQIACLGLSHRTAPVETREQLTCSLTDASRLLPAVGESMDEIDGRFAAIQEIAILSTCNRMELYAVVDGAFAAPRNLLGEMLQAIHQIDLDPFAEHIYFYEGEAAIHHLFNVAAGLDSLVLGEPQILGQVNDAYQAAVEAHTLGPRLNAIFQAAIRAGKRARTETAISSNPASISSVAISLAQEVLGDLTARRALVVGLGEMGQLALKSLRHRGVDDVSVANRTVSRAETAVSGGDGVAYSLDQLPAALSQMDVVITATASPQPIISAAMVAGVTAGREERPFVLIDIAVPRDVDPAARNVPGVHLFDVDDLQGTLDSALAARRREVPRVETIIHQEISCLRAELQELAIKPLIVDLRRKAEAIRQRELKRTMRYLDDVDPETMEHIQHLSRSLVNKLLHDPTIRLKAKASNGHAANYAAAVRDLFALETTTNGSNQ